MRSTAIFGTGDAENQLLVIRLTGMGMNGMAGNCIASEPSQGEAAVGVCGYVVFDERDVNRQEYQGSGYGLADV
jgi:hypothetical protein